MPQGGRNFCVFLLSCTGVTARAGQARLGVRTPGRAAIPVCTAHEGVHEGRAVQTPPPIAPSFYSLGTHTHRGELCVLLRVVVVLQRGFKFQILRP